MDSRISSSPRSLARRVPWRAGLLAVLLTIIGTLALPVAVQAHTDLTSSSPVDGAVLDAPPEAITLTFEDDLLAGSSSIALNDMTGTTVLSGPVDAVGPTITVPWPAELPAGTYQVAYRVVSADGHPVTGVISFTVAEAPADSSAEPSAVSSTSDPGAGSTAEPTTETTAEPLTAPPTAEPVDAAPAGVTGSAQMLNPAVMSVVAIALVATALVATAIVFMRRGRSR